ncbi:MAG TPA: transcription termination/antitermination NusG family protein [Hanamia sp.]|nr:transcription termination/antitermination NusG family protein [Hanamia sp.]
MQKNWYIIYTKPKCEKKVAAIFSKKKIENFLPVTCKQGNSIWKSKLVYEPLFDSYIFAKITNTEIAKIRTVDGVLNLVYWKGEPATIRENEIEVIREFISDYQDIHLEKTLINPDEHMKAIDGPKYSMEGNLLTIKNTAIKVNLPSIGFTMVAKINSDKVIGREISFGNSELLLQS